MSLESALGQNAKYYPEQIWSASPPNSDIVLRGAALRICANRRHQTRIAARRVSQTERGRLARLAPSSPGSLRATFSVCLSHASLHVKLSICSRLRPTYGILLQLVVIGPELVAVGA